MVDNPNIILITIDCLRNDFYIKNSRINLPFLNILTNFSNYYPNCLSLSQNTEHAFPGLLTSTYANFFNYNPSIKKSISRIAPPRVSIAEKFKELGYNTYAFQTNSYLSPEFGYSKGFDQYHFFNPYQKITKTPSINLKLIKLPYVKAKFLNKIIKKTKLEKPFFLWIHYMDLHEPYYYKIYPNLLLNLLWYKYLPKEKFRIIKKEEILLNEKKYKYFQRIFRYLYKRDIEYVDTQIYNLFFKSDSSDNALDFESSLIIVTSDHGQLLGEYGNWGHGVDLIPTPELINVPLYIKYPNQSHKKTSTSNCTLMDLAPTFYDYFQIEKPAETEGVSLLKKKVSKRSDYLFIDDTLAFANNKFSFSLIKGPYIFMRNDWHLKKPILLKLKDNKIIHIKNSPEIDKFEKKSIEYIEYFKQKQDKYKNYYSENNIKPTEALKKQIKGLGYFD